MLRKAIIAALAVAAVAAAAWCVLAWWQLAEGGSATLVLVSGEAEALRGGATRRLPASSTSEVRSGSEIKTGSNSLATLVLTPSVSVMLESQGAVFLRQTAREAIEGSALSVLVQRGRTLHVVRESSQPTSPYEVLTPACSVMLSPGSYSVEVADTGETVVEVFQGLATVSARDSVVELLQGEYTSMAPGRAPSIPRAKVARYVYVSARSGNLDIWLLDEEGRHTQLTHAAADDLAPVWSPDGTRIAFESQRDGNSEIYVMGADGSNQVNLTSHLADDHAPAWSPDGSLIAFESLRDGARELYVMNADGAGVARLTLGPGLSVSPHWDIGSSEIIFSRIEDDSNGDGMVDLRDMSAFFSVPPAGGTAGSFWYTRFVFEEFVFPWSRRGVG